jgi:hypothetical protein
MTQILSTEVFAVAGEGDIARAGRQVRILAQRHGFDAFALAAIVTAT